MARTRESAREAVAPSERPGRWGARGQEGAEPSCPRMADPLRVTSCARGAQLPKYSHIVNIPCGPPQLRIINYNLTIDTFLQCPILIKYIHNRGNFMKKLSFFVLLPLCFFACVMTPILPNDEFEISKDDFKGILVARAVMWNVSQETTTMMGNTFPKFNVKVQLYREVAKNKSDATLKVFIITDMQKEILGNSAFIKIDDKKIDLRVQNQNVEHRTVSSVAVSSSGSSASTSSTKTLLGEIKLPGDIGGSVKDESNVVLRLYSGDEPITIIFSRKNIKNMVKIFEAK